MAAKKESALDIMARYPAIKQIKVDKDGIQVLMKSKWKDVKSLPPAMRRDILAITDTLS